MKPAAFAVERPESLSDALRVLAEHGDAAKPIAGGQSLYPLLALRFARPDVLVDLTSLREPELREVDGDALHARVGALVPHVALREHRVFATPEWSALRTASRHIGHYPIQVRGTIGGSLAHADPSAELCALALLFDAELGVTGAAGSRRVTAAEWLRGPFTTALGPDELLTEVVFSAPAGARSLFAEVAPRPGDFALACAGLLVAPGGEARVVVGTAAAGPRRCSDAERLLAASADATAIGDAAAAMDDDPVRRHLLRGLVAKLARVALAEEAAR